MSIVDQISDAVMGTGHMLLNEKNKAIIDGDKDAVKKLKKMDRAIGKLMKPFNGAARIPDDVADRIEALVKAHARAIESVKATKLRHRGRAEIIGDMLFGDKPVLHEQLTRLEYENVYTSPNGVKIEQRLAVAPLRR